jgi:hypothetical protein
MREVTARRESLGLCGVWLFSWFWLEFLVRMHGWWVWFHGSGSVLEMSFQLEEEGYGGQVGD